MNFIKVVLLIFYAICYWVCGTISLTTLLSMVEKRSTVILFHIPATPFTVILFGYISLASFLVFAILFIKFLSERKVNCDT